MKASGSASSVTISTSEVEAFSPRHNSSLESPRKSAAVVRQSMATAQKKSYDELLAELGSGNTATQELDPIQMSKDVDLLKARLQKHDRGLLNPRGKLMQYWDFFTLSALFFTSTVTPYEVAFLWEEPKFFDPPEKIGAWMPLFVINILVNLVFMVDIVFNFFLPYKEPVKKGGGLIKSHKRIAKNYLTSWFIIDIISVLPVDQVMMAVDTANMGSSTSVLGMIRMLRLLRLLKLARILRASRIFSRWENEISLSSGNLSLIRVFIVRPIRIHTQTRARTQQRHHRALTLGLHACECGAARAAAATLARLPSRPHGSADDAAARLSWPRRVRAAPD